ncbi:MAG: hypothetical protein ABS43_27490 [Bordetella sp. SCN 67-23]|nr:DUF802 domain-containing protein [Burkholderiales bacterium]ODS68729.1 MAG: hypothetical protein ABS43_27490 [Bordetella sp. SCN 67-23]ODU69333.1 MAG: hypothetical protein ABT00_19105 [Bordetella sp. SCN 68-11]OJW93889.1 MAG: hypothetical protein BGO71_18550 [Burkholderiales bacterium 67-32]
MSRYLPFVVFFVGLAVVGWVGVGYVGSNLLALAVILLIAAFYVLGGLELRRFHEATSSLARAAADLSAPPSSLGTWLEQVHPSLRNAVRLRVEGERVGLPGPALTPYLAGLLVLLGMLGTFLGMVATLRGTGVALESATDLQAIRASLAAPVKGLGFAFGTSVAGVAASAMLGLLASLCRRERLQAAQALDTRIATVLRPYSLAHQREESFKLLQRQADLMPALVDRLQALAESVAKHNEALGERLAAGQESFHGRVESEYRRLAGSVEQSLKESLADSARVAGATIQPAVETAMAGLARETASLHETVTQAVQRQLDTLSSRFETSTATVADTWTTALGEHRRTSDALAGDLRTALEGFAQTFEQRSASLVDGVSARLEASVDKVSATWGTALAAHQQTNETLSGELRATFDGVAQAFAQRSTEMVETVAARLENVAGQVSEAWSAALAGHQRTSEALAGDVRASFDRLAGDFEQRSVGLVDGIAARLDATAGTVSGAWSTVLDEHRRTGETLAGDMRASFDRFAATFEQGAASLVDRVAGQLEAVVQNVSGVWNEALARHGQASEQLSGDTRQALAEAAATFERHAASLLDTVGQAHGELRSELASRDEARQAAWTGALETLAGSLSQEWREAGAQIAGRQQEVCETLARTAGDISSESQSHARATIAEIERLVQAASEAPLAAAQIIGELRQQLSDGMTRDNAMLEERERLLQTVGSLLDTVNHASTEQREAVDALVAASADMLDRVGTRFTEQVGAETGKLESVAAQVTGSAAEVASLGEALGQAVKLFGESSDRLMEQLRGIEGALDKAVARSDEQLAYYVAQAKDVIDLSMMSQKQIVEELRQLDAQRAPAGDAS